MDEPKKVKADKRYFILGLLTPFFLGILAAVISSVLSSTSSLSGSASTIITFFALSPYGVLLVFLLLFIRGKNSDNVKMWSYGKGGMIAYLVMIVMAVLLGLLAFGACMLSAGSYGR